MSEFKGTPSPWKMCGEDRGGCVCGQIWGDTNSVEQRPVATCHHHACKRAECVDMPNPRREEQQANMRLIAAAPELLEACEALLVEWEVMERLQGTHGWKEVAVDRAANAIAKAKGE